VSTRPSFEFDYIRDPAEIYRRSFAAVRAETALDGIPTELHGLALRIVHASGSPELAANLSWNGDPMAAGRAALATGALIFVDAEMVGAGIIRQRLTTGNQVICTINDENTPARAIEIGNTRSAAAVDLWGERLGGAIAVFGNAPTALFRLLERLAKGAAPPAVILGFPVGFIGAAESKVALIAHAGEIPFVTLSGRRGGSAIAAAAVNALVGDGEDDGR